MKSENKEGKVGNEIDKTEVKKEGELKMKVLFM